MHRRDSDISRADSPVAIAIGGHDPTSGAGVVADAAVMAALGVHPLTVVTGLTEQDSAGVAAMVAADAGFVRRVLDRIARDFDIAAAKIGMLASIEVAREVAAWIDEWRASRARETAALVLDPVVLASDGRSLLAGYERGVLARLVAQATIVTPNLNEAALLTGVDVGTAAGCGDAARALLDAGASAVLIKGGHAEGAPVDRLYTRDGERTWRWEREGETPHGTGCAVASAIAANLALGRDMEGAVDEALTFVQERIRRAMGLGRGRSIMRLR
ncbi:MAG: hydroxymethylpyrimidine/phosphomethylpyrimidine kinase [Deltaproteobacteria bacterium]|nr:hydroxymethylpyrimidine/phosphomethylpyrimidine kinase [Deltaproteobacteria bacterium]